MCEARKDTSIYPPVKDYLDRKHQIFRKDYRTEDGKYAESCSAMAIDIAELLLQDGEKPSLMSIRGDEVKKSCWEYNKPLVPKVYDGRISWGRHVVCALGDTILDPMVGKPMKAEDYRREVFTEPVNIEEAVSAEFIEEFIQRGKLKQ